MLVVLPERCLQYLMYPHSYKWCRQNIRNTSKNNAIQFNSTTNSLQSGEINLNQHKHEHNLHEDNDLLHGCCNRVYLLLPGVPNKLVSYFHS